MIFVAPGTFVDPPLAPTVRGLSCPPAVPSDHWYGGLGGSLGNFEAWKPRKVGGCGWTSCLRDLGLSHVAQDTARFWFRGVGAHGADFGALVRAKGTTCCIHVAEGTKLDQNGLKIRSKHLFVHPRWSEITFGKMCFGPIFHPFLLPKGPLFKEYWDFHGPKPVPMGSKWAKNTCLSIPNGLRSLLKITFLTNFGPICGPKTAHFQAILGFSMAHNASF